MKLVSRSVLLIALGVCRPETSQPSEQISAKTTKEPPILMNKLKVDQNWPERANGRRYVLDATTSRLGYGSG